MTTITPLPMDQTREIIREVAERYGIPLAAMTGASRKHCYAVARQAAYAEVRARRLHLSSKQIGQVFGRDGSTVYVGIQTHHARMAWAECLIAAAGEHQPDLFARAA